ncbi:phosphatase PAP2 family protein [Pseudorhodoferax sp.]|uniref:phosphatase PAP2 family protein n=1 Tax=Pseudorhodoferax sp. TaxID=1993553 RepID=UPI0039E5A320
MNGQWFAWFFVCLLVGSFIILTSEVHEALAGEKELIGAVDQLLLRLVVEHRTRLLNGIAIDLTALGSATGLSILTLFLCVFFLLRRKLHLAVHALLAAGGAAGLTAALKFYFERSRPDAALRLVDVQGFSYPSGHSLASAAIYFTCAILVARPLPGLRSRSVVWAFFLVLIGTIGLTRIYLGVHFFSDVLAGIMIGIAWAALLEIGMSHLGERLQCNTRT